MRKKRQVHLTTNEGETIIKHYHNVAQLSTWYKAMKATLSVAVSNKRIIFCAVGTCFRGETTLTYEFDVHKIKGIDIRQDWIFSWFRFIVSSIVTIAIASGFMLLVSLFASIAVVFMLGIFGIFVCFLLKPLMEILIKQSPQIKSYWIISKLIGIIRNPHHIVQLIVISFVAGIFSAFGQIIAMDFISLAIFVISLVFCIFAIFRVSMLENLVLILKSEGATPAIEICRDKNSFFGSKDIKYEYTGYSYVKPGKSTAGIIKELNAVISDIQTMGDFSIDKWKKFNFIYEPKEIMFWQNEVDIDSNWRMRR